MIKRPTIVKNGTMIVSFCSSITSQCSTSMHSHIFDKCRKGCPSYFMKSLEVIYQLNEEVRNQPKARAPKAIDNPPLLHASMNLVCHSLIPASHEFEFNYYTEDSIELASILTFHRALKPR
jgi:hypothetical protein